MGQWNFNTLYNNHYNTKKNFLSLVQLYLVNSVLCSVKSGKMLCKYGAVLDEICFSLIHNNLGKCYW